MDEKASGSGAGRGENTMSPPSLKGGKDSRGEPGLSLGCTALFLLCLCLGIFGGAYLSAKSKHCFRGPIPAYAAECGQPRAPGQTLEKNRFRFVVFGDTRTEFFVKTDIRSRDEIKEELKKRYEGLKKEEILIEREGRDWKEWTLGIPRKGLRARYKDGWPEKIWKNGKLAYIKGGIEAVYKRVFEELSPKRDRPGPPAGFAINTGDLVLWSKSGGGKYWDYFNRQFYKRLKGIRRHRFFYPVIGNHEVWVESGRKGDPAGEFLGRFPHLELKKSCHDYSFKHQNGYFIFLCAGTYLEDRCYSYWKCYARTFGEQMAWLKERLEKATKDKDIRHIFLTYHKPPFSNSEHPPLWPTQDPAHYLRDHLKGNNRVSVTVFNGHNHTTEMYRWHGIRIFVMGGGGAPQELEAVKRPGQPEELFWRGPRKLNFNYLMVDVDGEAVTFTLFEYIPERSDGFTPGHVPEEMQIAPPEKGGRAKEAA